MPTNTENLFERNPTKSSALLILTGICIALILTEIALRFSSNLLKDEIRGSSDQLVVLDKFLTDSNGVFKANPASAGWTESIDINSRGFRGPEFAPANPGQRSILVLGDSFAWGSGARSTTPFADLMRLAGHRVYNTGIPGTGPTQYEFLARSYLPQLRPDYVVTSFYMGNDLRERPDPMMPHKNLWHITNAGWIWGFDRNQQPLTPQEAYDHYVGAEQQKKFSLPSLIKIGIKTTKNTFENEDKSLAHLREKYTYTFATLQNIKNMTQEQGAKFVLLIIPNDGENCSDGSDKIDDLKPIFDELNPIYLDTLPKSTFSPAPDCHLNDEGHRLVAERILSLL